MVSEYRRPCIAATPELWGLGYGPQVSLTQHSAGAVSHRLSGKNYTIL